LSCKPKKTNTAAFKKPAKEKFLAGFLLSNAKYCKRIAFIVHNFTDYVLIKYTQSLI